MTREKSKRGQAREVAAKVTEEDIEALKQALAEEKAKSESHLANWQRAQRKLWASLETQGLSQIKALSEPFDPQLHEAAMHGKGKEGIVVEELQKGYKLHDRVLRPTMVVVGNGEEEEKEE